MGLFVKLNKPDDFQPTINAIIETVRKMTSSYAVIEELDSNGQKFAALKYVQSLPISPTITESGPYLGIFLTETHAVRAFQRDDSISLQHNPDFVRQIGDKRNGASQVIYLDTPSILSHAYSTAMPYISMASMFSKQLADALKGKNLPPDVNWLAPIGTWSCVTTSDNDGITCYSVSGMGNQAILIGGFAQAGIFTAQSMGFFPKPNPSANSPAAAPSNSVAPADSTTPPSTPPDTSTTNAPSANPPMVSAPDTSTNSAPAAPDAPKPQ